MTVVDEVTRFSEWLVDECSSDHDLHAVRHLKDIYLHQVHENAARIAPPVSESVRTGDPYLNLSAPHTNAIMLMAGDMMHRRGLGDWKFSLIPDYEGDSGVLPARREIVMKVGDTRSAEGIMDLLCDAATRYVKQGKA